MATRSFLPSVDVIARYANEDRRFSERGKPTSRHIRLHLAPCNLLTVALPEALHPHDRFRPRATPRTASSLSSGWHPTVSALIQRRGSSRCRMGKCSLTDWRTMRTAARRTTGRCRARRIRMGNRAARYRRRCKVPKRAIPRPRMGDRRRLVCDRGGGRRTSIIPREGAIRSRAHSPHEEDANIAIGYFWLVDAFLVMQWFSSKNARRR